MAFGALPAAAAPGGATPASAPGLIQQAQYVFGGHEYCWYENGWRGPGWYWCGYGSRRGYGFGGGWGWNGWNDRGRTYERRDRDFDREYGGREYREYRRDFDRGERRDFDRDRRDWDGDRGDRESRGGRDRDEDYGRGYTR